MREVDTPMNTMFIQWFHRYIFYNIIKMEWLLYCNSSCLRKHTPSVPCSVLPSNKKEHEHMGSARLSFQGLPLFLGKEKSAKCTYFVTGHCFIHLPLIFSTQRLIISLQHIKLCLWTLCIMWCYERSFTEVVSKSLVSQQFKTLK